MAETTEAFQQRMSEVVVHAFLAPAIALGHQLRLFDAMAAFDDFQDVDIIAAKANCKPRYVKEWLQMMAVAHVVEIDESESKFFLPQHRRATLVSATNPLAFALDAIPQLTFNHNNIVDCFGSSGPYHANPSPSMYDILENRVPDWGMFWQTVVVPVLPRLDEHLKVGATFCDIGCGGGGLLVYLSQHYPKSHFTGVDIRTQYIEAAKAKVTVQSNVEFVVDDVMKPSVLVEEQFDYIHACLVLHDLTYPDQGAATMYRLLKPGGQAILGELDFDSSVRAQAQVPASTMFYGFSLYYCLSDAYTTDSCHPMGSVPGRQQFQDVLLHAGFSSVAFHGVGDNMRTLIIEATK